MIDLNKLLIAESEMLKYVIEGVFNMLNSNISKNVKEILARKKVVTSKEIVKEYVTHYPKIHTHSVSTALLRLYRQKEVARSKYQTSEGYIYGLPKERCRLEKLFIKLALPKGISKSNYSKITKELYKQPQNIASSIAPNTMLKKFAIKKVPAQFEYLLNLELSSPEIVMLVKCIAFMHGDGHISKTLHDAQFFFRYEKDALQFQSDFYELYGIKTKIHYRKNNCYLRPLQCASDFARLLYALGAPAGNKMHQKFEIPYWILKGPNPTRKAYLSTIIGNEGSKPGIKGYRIRVVLSKHISYLEEHLLYLNQIRDLLFSSSITADRLQLGKQKRRNYHCFFYIKGKKNLLNFYKSLEFAYASEKQDILVEIVKTMGYEDVNTHRPPPGMM